MGAHDSAQLCDLVGILLLWGRRFISDMINNSIYRAEGVILLRELRVRQAD